MAYCVACGAEIEFVKTVARKTVPVNVEPVWVKLIPGGGTFLKKNGEFAFGMIIGDAEDDPDSNCVEAYIPHKGVCPLGGKKPRARSRRG